MENRIAKLKLDDSVNEETAKDNAAELELECVSNFLLRSYFVYNYFFLSSAIYKKNFIVDVGE